MMWCEFGFRRAEGWTRGGERGVNVGGNGGRMDEEEAVGHGTTVRTQEHEPLGRKPQVLSKRPLWYVCACVRVLPWVSGTTKRRDRKHHMQARDNQIRGPFDAG